MPIDPYEPELAKRKTVITIADRQSREAMNGFTNDYSTKISRPDRDVDTGQSLENVLVALKDYAQAAKELTEWIEHKKTQE